MIRKMIDRLLASRRANARAALRRNRRVERPNLEAVEARRLLSIVYWNNTSDGNWSNAANWTVSGSNPVVHRLPGPTDDVQIETEHDITVTISSGADSVRSLSAWDNLVMTGGSLTVGTNSSVNSLTIAAGASFNVDANATLTIGEDSVIAGTIAAPALATVVFNANQIVLDSSAALTGAGNFNLVSGQLKTNGGVTAPLNFELGGGDLYENGSFTVPAGSTFTWRSGALDGSGQTVISKGASLVIAGSDTKYLQHGTVLVNNGTATWGDLGTIYFNVGGATIDNYGSWTATTNESIGGGSGMIFNNYGTFAKSIGTGSGVGDTVISAGNFNNFGTVDGGDLIIDTTGDQDSGTWFAAPNTSIEFNGGSQTLNAGTKLTGQGVYEIGSTSMRIDNNFNVANLYVLPGAYLYGNWQLTVTTFLGWEGGTIAGPGAINIAAAATMNIENNSNVSLYGTINNAGTLDWTGPAGIYGASGAVINNSGTFNIHSDGSTATIAVNNTGTLNSSSPSGNGTTTFADSMNNSGKLNVKSGTLLLDAPGSSTNAIDNVAAGAVLVFAGGGAETVSGTFTGSGAGTINFSNMVMSIAPAGATLDAPAGLFQWTGGMITGGPLTLASGSVITISGSGTHYLDNGTLDNDGTIDVDGLGSLSFGEGVADTSPGILNNYGTINFLGDEIITNNSVFARGSINNSGTVQKSGGTGSIFVTNVNFNNAAAGVVDVQSGTLDLAAGVDTGGTFNVAAGSILDLTQGQNATFTGSFAGSGSGIVQISGGVVTIGSAGATFDFPAGLFQWTGGTLSVPPGATLNLDGTVALVGTAGEALGGGGTVNVGGTINQSGTGNLFIAGSGNTATTVVLSKGSKYNLAADSGIAQGGGDGGILDNLGTITKTGGLNSSVISTSFNNLGAAISVQKGTLTIASAGGASSGGTFTVATGAALDLTGGQTVDYAGTYSGSGGGQIQLNSGTLVVAGGSAGTTFSFPAGLFRWNGGMINTNNSTLTISSGKSIALTGFSGETLSGGGTLTVSGAVNQTGVGNLYVGGGTILSITKTGSYNFQNDSGIAVRRVSRRHRGQRRHPRQDRRNQRLDDLHAAQQLGHRGGRHRHARRHRRRQPGDRLHA